ncbi:hypothetical protein [Microbacterium gorillae]|uniref:hypothetical protein n=1 Tax=Microbacterium gorillae TaxID=1231063 RepID=UPI00058EE691|nr:hypothetical protein [Microbacterium gorillae]
MDELDLPQESVAPVDVSAWLALRGWQLTASLGDIAQRWQGQNADAVVPLLRSAPDFSLRWDEMLNRLGAAFQTDAAGVLLAVTKSGSDVAEFRATGQIDDSLPLGDAATFIDSVRRGMQASASSALQPRSYFGHRVPDAARDHARKVRMGQTRRGSYIVPVISRLPMLRPEYADDEVLFDDATYQPFARTAMLRLAEGLNAVRDLTHGSAAPSPRSITEAVGAGVSAELCEAVANTLETESIDGLEVNFSWASRLPALKAPQAIALEDGAVTVIREVERVLKGAPQVGRQTLIGYVKRLDRGEDDEVGRVTLRVLDNDKARNVTVELDDAEYHIAGEANTERKMVSATGILHRTPGHALRLTDVDRFAFQDALSGLFTE